MAEKSNQKQLAIGNFIAQALGDSAEAIVHIEQQPALTPIPLVPPSPPHNFTGRIHTLEVLKSLLLNVEKREAIALVGMGGIGKTATVKKLAVDMNNDFPGGINWASLAECNGNPLPILHTWAIGCGVRLPNNLDQIALLTIVRGLLQKQKLRMGPILFVIDDIREDWLRSAQLLIDTIPHDSPLLITTRRRNLAQVLNTSIYPLEVLQPQDALQLLIRIIDNENMKNNHCELLNIVEIVGYLPLAVELLGKKLSKYLQKPGYEISSLKMEIEKKSTNVLELPGHRGLASTFAVTYDELDKMSQQVFRWLGGFASGPIYKPDLFEILKSGVSFPDKEKVLETILDELVDFSLLNWSNIPQSYTFHPLLHQYAKELLAMEMEEDIAYEHHMMFYYDRIISKELENSRYTENIEMRLGNFLLAAERAFIINDHDRFIGMAHILGRVDGYLYANGYWDEALELLTKCFKLSEDRNDDPLSRDIIWQLGTLKREMGKYAKAKELLSTAVDIERQKGNQYSIASSLFGLGYVHLYLAEYEDAERIFKETLVVAKDGENHYALGEALRGLGRVYLAQNLIDKAEDYFTKSIPILIQSNNIQGKIYAIRGLGETYLISNRIDDALSKINEALELAIKNQDKQAIGYTLRALGNVCVTIKEYPLAKEVYIQCINICNSIGEIGSLAASQCLLGDVFVHLDNLAEAENLFIQSKKISTSLGLNRWLARSDFGLAKVYYRQNLLEDAQVNANASIKILSSIKHRDVNIVREWEETKFKKQASDNEISLL